MAAEVRISVANLFQAAALVIAANIVFFLLLFVVDASINHRALHDRLVDAAAHGVPVRSHGTSVDLQHLCEGPHSREHLPLPHQP